MRTTLRRLGTLWAAALCWLTPSLALAQQFEKVSGAVREELPAARFVAAAYSFIWIAVLLYVVWVASGYAKVRKDLDELKRKIERSSGGSPERSIDRADQRR
jgi:hypothetical protein